MGEVDMGAKQGGPKVPPNSPSDLDGLVAPQNKEKKFMSLASLGVNPPKGFRDILPQETVIRDQLLTVIIDTYRSYGFERIDTPVVEDIRRLKHSEGGENLGLMFKILKRGDKLDIQSGLADCDNLVDMGLRYDLTVPVARYVANNRGVLPPVFKSIQIGSVWRAERPQHGRYRQFTQCDIDVFGGSAPYDEIELITVTLATLEKLGITGATVRVNDRQLLNMMVAQAGMPVEMTGRALVDFDKMDKVGLSGVRQALLKDGFETAAVDKFIGFAEKIDKADPSSRLAEARKEFGGNLPESVFENLNTIITVCSAGLKNGNRIVFDPFLVRGMGYYTGPVFEIVVPEFLSSLAGGGRYDKLIGKLSGADTPACGFSIGFERLVEILEAKRLKVQGGAKKVVVLFDQEKDPIDQVLATVHEIQAGGAIDSMYATPKNVRGLLDKLKQSGYTHVLRVKAGEPVEPRPLQ